MKVNIKNMNSADCLAQVKHEFGKLGLNDVVVEIGTAVFNHNISEDQLLQINLALSGAGFILPEYRKLQLVVKIKDVITEYVHYTNEQVNLNFSDHLSARLQYDYTYLANLFSKETGITIEKFIITQRIQHAKTLINNYNLKLADIARMLHYSSVAHFSNQFKQVSGLTPSSFRKQVGKERLPV